MTDVPNSPNVGVSTVNPLSLTSDRWLTILSLAAAMLVFLRFLHLDADFPLGINWSADVYTDEGLYSNAATRHVVSGEWYLAGDLNAAINMPLGQLLHRMAFSIFGLSFFRAHFGGFSLCSCHCIRGVDRTPKFRNLGRHSDRAYPCIELPWVCF